MEAGGGSRRYRWEQHVEVEAGDHLSTLTIQPGSVSLTTSSLREPGEEDNADLGREAGCWMKTPVTRQDDMEAILPDTGGVGQEEAVGRLGTSRFGRSSTGTGTCSRSMADLRSESSFVILI